MTSKVKVQGHCDERFTAVKEAFQRNFESGEEIGASFAATIDGKFVVDIWGGYADAAQTRPWERDTIVNVYSVTKVMTAICTLMLVDRGQLDLDAPVARYWPEFAQAGKENIPFKYLLSHQSGVSGFDEDIPLDALYDWDRMIKLLEKQKPLWKPGKHCGYHAMTFGYLIGEVVRRITKKTLGNFFREEVATPLGADFHIGLPAEHDHRAGEMTPPPELKPGDPGYIDPELVSEISIKSLRPPLNVDQAMRSRDRAWRVAEIPSVNGHGNARSVARVGAAMACGGELDGVRLMSLSTIEKAIEEQCYETDLVMNMPTRYGLGFGLVCKDTPIGPNPRTFYWRGWGGAVMVMDLDARLSWAYVMNNMSADILDPRGTRIGETLYAAL